MKGISTEMAELEEKVGGDGLPAVEEALAGWLRLIHTATKAKISFVKPIRSTGIGASVAHRDPCNMGLPLGNYVLTCLVPFIVPEFVVR